MLETLEDYHFPPEMDRYSKYRKQWAGEEAEETKVEEEVELEVPPETGSVLPGLDNVKFIFLNDPLDSILTRAKFQGLFDRVILGYNANGKLSAAINNICAVS
jgi:hypothetical protein